MLLFTILCWNDRTYIFALLQFQPVQTSVAIVPAKKVRIMRTEIITSSFEPYTCNANLPLEIGETYSFHR